ncbi:uncharacterized protein LOC125568242 [Nematostella vectensis]|uniref:uncharacterized protein LOC125568242 n=1 Tax=Nematostella vectensis TaxID=45351 RepID=UPI00207797B1|nr:uncharacterized protein LOC125568242 [Nematostella vectensis]
MATALLVAPLHTAQLFADMYSTTWSCRATRLPVHAMGSITVLNLLLLGIERYCAIFHPFFIPSESMIKVCFLGIWLGGGLLGFLQVLQLDAIPVVTSQTEYTISCQPIMDTLFKKCLSTSFLVIIIPCIAFLFITIRTTKYLSDRRKKVESGKGVYLHKIHAWRIKETKVCVCIILTFIVPYVFYVVNIIMRPNFSICIDYCMRRTQDTLVLLNCVITPLVTMYGGRLFREMAMKRINMILRRLMNQETAHLQTTKTQTVETAL